MTILLVLSVKTTSLSVSISTDEFKTCYFHSEHVRRQINLLSLYFHRQREGIVLAGGRLWGLPGAPVLLSQWHEALCLHFHGRLTRGGPLPESTRVVLYCKAPGATSYFIAGGFASPPTLSALYFYTVYVLHRQVPPSTMLSVFSSLTLP